MGIGEQPTELAQLKALLTRSPTEDMICWRVGPRVGNVKNVDLSLIEPVIDGFPAMIVTASPTWHLHVESHSPALAPAFHVLPVSSAPSLRYLTTRGGGCRKYHPTK